MADRLRFISAACIWLAAPLAFAAGGDMLNHPTGTHGLLMVDKMGGYIRFFDPHSDRELSSFASAEEDGVRPHELALSPDHKTAYVTVYGDGIFGKNPHPGHTIAIIDLVAQKMVGVIDVAPYQAPHGLQVDQSGMLYVACDLSHKVLVIDPVKRHIDAAIDVESMGHWVALSARTNKLYVSSHGDQPFIGVIDLKSRRMTGRVPVATGTMGISVSPDGKTLLAANLSGPTLHVISTDTDREVATLTLQGAAIDEYVRKVFYSPDGKYAVVCTQSGQVNIFDAADLHRPQHVLKLPGTALMGVAFSADCRTALVGNHDQGTVSRIDLESGTLLDTFPAGKGIETLTYF
jgi:DNA-binding beta-propeller fold protein YncE